MTNARFAAKLRHAGNGAEDFHEQGKITKAGRPVATPNAGDENAGRSGLKAETHWFTVRLVRVS
jgi:hypothetical protein